MMPSRVTSLIAPPPWRSGAASSSRCADRADEGAGPEGRVELVAREGEEVDARAGHVDRAVGRELRGVDEELGAVAVRDRGEPLATRPDLARDVGRAGQGDQVDRGRAECSASSQAAHSASGDRGEREELRSCRRQGSMFAWCSARRCRERVCRVGAWRTER